MENLIDARIDHFPTSRAKPDRKNTMHLLILKFPTFPGLTSSLVVQRNLLSAIVCAGALMINGCLSTSISEANYLHNPADFTVVKQAKETSENIDYLAVIAQEREVQAHILERELAVVDHFATARRNFELLNISGPEGVTPANLMTKIEEREELLLGEKKPVLKNIKLLDMTEPRDEPCGAGLIDPAGSAHSTTKSWLKAQLESLEICVGELADQSELYAGVLNFDPPKCPSEGNVTAFKDLTNKKIATLIEKYKKAYPTRSWTDEKIKMVLSAQHDSYAKKCQLVRSHERAVVAMLDGCEEKACGPNAPNGAKVIGIKGKFTEAYLRLNGAVTALRADQTAANSAAAEYKAVEAAYETAAKAHADGPSDETSGKLESAGKEVKAALDRVGQAGGAFGVDLLTEEQIKGVDTILAAISSGDYDADALAKACKTDVKACTLSSASAVAATLPTLIDQAKHIQSLSEAPPLSALVLEKARLLALQQSAKKAIDRRNREIAQLRSIVEAYIGEAGQLLRADQLLKSAVKKANAGDQVQARAWRLRAVAAYLDTFANQRRTVHAAEYQLAALEHEAAIDYSETSLKIWESAIKTPIAALYAYYEGGLKPEDIIELLKAAGLAGISFGVN